MKRNIQQLVLNSIYKKKKKNIVKAVKISDAILTLH